MVFKRLRSGIEIADEDFDAIYTERIKRISEFHFTPVDVAKTAARYLAVKPGARVLDIGSGAGKFCMIGSVCTGGHFTGVEQREHLHLLSKQLASRHRLTNTTFIHSNITDINFQGFDAVYFFNAFYENIFQSDPIDHSIQLDRQLYDTYSQYVKKQLDALPSGTRLATYFTYADEIPDSYQIEFTCFDGKLKLWKKCHVHNENRGIG